MRAILLCASESSLCSVYGARQMQRLQGLTELWPASVCTPEAARETNAEVAFSTWGMPAFTEADYAMCLPRLKAVFYAAGSVRAFAPTLFSRGIRLFSGWRANAVPVAQFAHAQIMLAAKGYFAVARASRESRAEGRAAFAHYPGGYELRVGLLGMGAIGTLVAQRLRLDGIETLCCDPYLTEERANALGARKAGLSEIFATCDIVSNHLPDLPATKGMVTAELLSSMKPYATFINTARGAQIDEAGLYRALTDAPTRTALLDVLTDESRAEESPLYRLPNCVVTPHIAGSAGLETHRMADRMLDAFEKYVRGETDTDEITPDMLHILA